MNVCLGFDVDLREVYNVVIFVFNNFLCDGVSYIGYNFMVMFE